MKPYLLFFVSLTAYILSGLHAVAQSTEEVAKPPLRLTCVTTNAPVPGAFFRTGDNRGVAPPGFVALGNTAVQHGVDVSKWQRDVDPFAVKQCGGAFAYIRISAGRLGFNEISYPSTWGQARAANLFIGPYHYLTFFPESIERHSLRPTSSPQQIVEAFEKLGHQQAALFLERYKVLHEDDLKRNPNARFMPPMVAITDQKPLPPPFTQLRREWAFATICAFIGDVERQPWLHGQRLIIFAEPGDFEQRGYGNAPCLKATHRIFWVEYPSEGAVGLPENAQDPKFKVINELCHPIDNSRDCRFHQYTNRGGLPMGSLSDGLDLSRYLGDASSLQKLSIGG